jgi:hypothetical protein
MESMQLPFLSYQVAFDGSIREQRTSAEAVEAP